MGQFLKNHWKTIVIIILVLALIWFVVLPRYNQVIYDAILEELSNNGAIPLRITQGNETQIIPINVCSQFFQQQYQDICGVPE